MQPTFFATPADLREGFNRHHESVTELLVLSYKKDSGKPSITWLNGLTRLYASAGLMGYEQGWMMKAV